MPSEAFTSSLILEKKHARDAMMAALLKEHEEIERKISAQIKLKELKAEKAELLKAQEKHFGRPGDREKGGWKGKVALAALFAGAALPLKDQKPIQHTEIETKTVPHTKTHRPKNPHHAPHHATAPTVAGPDSSAPDLDSVVAPSVNLPSHTTWEGTPDVIPNEARPKIQEFAPVPFSDTKLFEIPASQRDALKEFDVPPVHYSLDSITTVGESHTQRATDSLSAIPVEDARLLDTGALSRDPMQLRDVPSYAFPVDTVAAKPSFSMPSMPARFPEGTVLPRSGEVVDSTTQFHFGGVEFNKHPSAAKAATSVEQHGGKIRVTNIDERGVVFDPSTYKKLDQVTHVASTHSAFALESDFVAKAETQRMDSVFNTEKNMQVGDTAVLSTFVDISPELAEKHLKSHGSKIERVLLPDGTYLTRIHYASQGIDTVKEMRWLAIDNQKIKIEGNRTVPSILEHLVDRKAWKKLIRYGDLDAQNIYFAQVESKKNGGTWFIDIKSKGVLMVFDGKNVLLGEFPSLTGATKGEALNTYTEAHIENGKTTPAGEYVLHALDPHEVGTFGHTSHGTLGMLRKNADGTLINQSIALHAEVPKNISGQEKDIHSGSAEDNHETIGCIRVDPEAMKLLMKDIGGRRVSTLYVTPEDPAFGIDPVTGETREMTPDQKYQIFHDGVVKFWNDNPVIYYISKVELKEENNGRGDYIVTSQRDPNATEKIHQIKVPDKDIQVPIFHK